MKKIILVLLLWGYFHAALAITPFIITDIRVEGLERLEAGTVYNYLPLKVGDELNDEEASLSIKELFSTGFFKDVVLEQDGTVLVVRVLERPSLAELKIVGNKLLDSAVLEQVLEDVGLVQGRIFNSASLGQVEQEIRNTYLSLGRYSAFVSTEVRELERNRVDVTLTINEGRVATIRKINIIGAGAIPVSTLIDEMSLRDRRGWGLFSRRDQYSKQKLEADIETIRSYYLDRGFHDFKIIDRSVDISPNKQNIFISISIDEGEKYTFGETVFETTRETPVTGLEDRITIKPGAVFSRKVVTASRNLIAEKYADEGYAFVEVNPVYEADREARVVNVVFAIDPKQRVYVRRVEITGNLRTRDQVIRRELRQFEGGWYSARAVSRSRARLQRLGYFDQVNIETPEVPGTTDQVDVKVTVSERKTGAITFSVGYSDTDGALVGGSYSQRNLLGTGRELSVTVDSSDSSRRAAVNYVNPYHTLDGVSRGISLSQRRIDTDDVSTSNFVVDATSAGLNYKIPVAETNSLNLGFVLEQLDIEASSGTPYEFERVIDPTFESNKGEGDNLVAKVGISRDTRNDFFFPSRGGRGSLALELSSPGSDYEYYKVSVQGSYYVPLSDSLTFKGEMGVGYGDGFGDTEELPFFRRYYAGGSNSVRGYDGRSLGPLSSGLTNCEPVPMDGMLTEGTEANPAVCSPPSSSRDTVGGNKRLLLNAELLFAPFGAEGGKDKRISLFVDAGMVFGEGYERCDGCDDGFRRIENTDIDLGALRYSAGFEFNWVSPIGPFSISYSEPLNDEEGDDTEKFQLNLGSVF